MKYAKDKRFFKLVNFLDNKSSNAIFEPDSVKRTDYVEKGDIDHSTLYVLVLVDLFLSKIYTYPMKSRKQIRLKLEEFYREVRSKRKGQKIKSQVDQEFQQVKIKYLNDLNNVKMFSTSLRGGKAFAAEQKIRELKTRKAKLNNEKLKISP